jgi:hypothetical protein
MLKLDTQEYLQAAAAMARALDRAETEGGFHTFSGRVCAVLDALGEEFDVTAMDLRDDTITDVWPETCGHCESGDHTTEEHRSALSQRLINEIDQYNRGLVNGE